MGANCLGCSSSPIKIPQYQRQPSDTCDFIPDKLPFKLKKLNFQAEVDNFQLINYPYDIAAVKLTLNNLYQCCLPRKIKNKIDLTETDCNQVSNTNKIKWKFQDTFEFTMDEYQIRKSFIKVGIFNQQLLPILQLKLNLYHIITGPYHHDLGLKFKNETVARLRFDLKISQKFQILINPLEVTVQLNQEYPGQEFNYSFNSYSCGQKISSADGSLPQKVSIFSNVQGSYRELKPEDECQSPTRIRKGTCFNKMIRNLMTSGLKWVKEQEFASKSSFKQTHQILEEELAMPSFKLFLKSNQINKSSLQFALWNIQFNKSISSNQAILFSDCYISFSRLLECDFLNLQQMETASSEDQTYKRRIRNKLQDRVCILEEPLIKDGKSIGKIKTKLKLVNQTYFSQLSLYARTEDGIVYMDAMLKNYLGKSHSLKPSESISKIESSFDRIIAHMYNLNHLTKQKKRNWTQISLNEQKVSQEFKFMQNLLNISIEQSLVLGRKHNFQEIIDRQNILLGILERLQILLSQQDCRFVIQIWKAILSIMKRGEFFLQNIGFSQYRSPNSPAYRQKQNDSSSEPTNQIIYLKKIKTALRYQQILYKVLTIALNYNYQNQRDTIVQAEAFKAYGYFRVPRFREQVLKCIVKNEENQQLDQQTNQIFQTQSKLVSALSKFEQKSSSHLDWQKYFYGPIKNQKKSHQLNSVLAQNFHNNAWLQNLSERRQNFSIFIQYFAKKMAELGKRLKLIRYSYCPGYHKLVKSFIIQMKRKLLVDYDSCMIETSMVLLTNHNLINIIIPIIVEKTNLYDNTVVNQFLNIFSTYIKYLTQNGTKTLPEKFNHTYFFKIIKMILESEYSYAIAKMLVIIHTYFQCFNDQFKDILSLYLLSKAFFRLFFHWSFNIRIIFYHLFIIKIYWSKLNGVTQKYNHMDTYKNENCQIFNRYKRLIKILNTAERQKMSKKRTMKKAERQEYFIKMKKKISNKISKNSQAMKKQKQYESAMDSSSELEYEKQKTLNLNRLQTLCELKDGYNRSQTLCSTQIKQHLKRIQSSHPQTSNSIEQTKMPLRKFSLNQKENIKPEQPYSINLKTNKKKLSGNISNGDTDTSVKEQIQKLNEDFIRKLSLNGHKMSSTQDKPLVYTFFGNQDYELEEISLNQQNKILLGMGQFRQTQEFVQKYILQKGVAPHVNLDPQIQIDSNQFKPQELASL